MVKVITDSTSDIPKQLAEELDIEVAPLTVHFGEESFKDGIDLSPDEFFEKLKKSQMMPTTSQVSIGEFADLFEEALKTHDAVLSIHISSELSGTYSAALQAKEMIGSDRIYVVDSKLVAFSLGLLVVECAERLKGGAGIEEVEAFARTSHETQASHYIIDTLEFLLKGGRLKKSEAFIGSLLNIKPILTIVDGVLKSVEKIRGNKKAVRFVMDKVLADYQRHAFKKIGVFKSGDAAMYAEIISRIEQEIPDVEVIRSEVGSVVGTHAGPGCAAITYFREGDNA